MLRLIPTRGDLCEEAGNQASGVAFVLHLTVRITRLQLQDFRGWSNLDLRPRGHVLLAGVPRAGRSDIVDALRRVVDPASIRMPPALGDIRQAAPEAAGDRAEVEQCVLPVNADYAEIEVTLVDLDPELE